MKNNKLKSVLKVFWFIIIIAALFFCFSLMSFAQIKYRAYLPKSSSESGYTQVPFKVKSKEESSSYNKAVNLPSSYDLRKENLITDVKDQGYYGTCWAFASIAAAESSLLKEFPEKYYNQTLDLSEAHLAYYSYNKAKDPLNLLGGDYTTTVYDHYLDFGGNFYMSTFSLSKWFGVANESVMPYDGLEYYSEHSSSAAYKNNEAVLENALWVSTENKNQIKELVLKYGACGISIFYDERYLSKKHTYYRWTSSKTNTNHSVTLVGWDDNYPKENFRTSIYGTPLVTPRKNGAWLIKNSYGTGEADCGYFWLSYEEKSILGDVAVFFDFMPADTYDFNYQYDGSNIMGMYYDIGKIHMANVFTAKSAESLDAFSFYAIDPNENFKYQIYTDVKGTSNPTNGNPVFTSYKNCSTEYAGYHTVKLPKSVALKKGTKFSVVLISTNKKGLASAAADYSGNPDMLGTIYSYTYSKKGQSFFSSDGKKWESPDNGENIRIKAFTTKRIVKLEKVTAPEAIYLTKGEKQAATLTPIPDEASAKAQWTSDNKTVAAVDSKGNIKGLDFGTTYINYVCTSNPNVRGRIKVTVRPEKAVPKLKNVYNTQFIFSWNKVPGADGYRINEKQKDGSYKAVSYTTGTSFKKTGLKNGQRFTYKVYAYKIVNGKKIYSASSVLCAFTKPSKTVLSKSKVSKTTVSLKWKKANGADMYRVYMYNPKTKKYESKGTVKGTSLTVKNLKVGTEYRFKIRSITVFGKTNYYSDYSSVLKVRTAKK